MATTQTETITQPLIPIVVSDDLSQPRAKTNLKVVFGAMTLGKEGAEGARIHTVEDVASVIDVLQQHGHNEIDTARVYGTSEALLGQLKWQERGLVMDTKLNPRRMGPYQYSHKKEDLKRGLLDSLQALNTDKVDLFYLHAPDHNTPYVETLEAVDELYRAGHFSRFGLSNYSAWEVAQICELCDRHGWKKPDVYQGSYNALQRSVEPELFPCLRAYGIAFYSFSPLAGGLLTGKYERDTVSHESGSRYDPARFQGKNFRGRYWNDAYFAALDVLRKTTEAHGISLGEAALRWSSHHSAMKRECGDAVVIGASSAAQLVQNLECLECGPLPEDVVEAFQKAWTIVKGVCVSYC